MLTRQGRKLNIGLQTSLPFKTWTPTANGKTLHSAQYNTACVCNCHRMLLDSSSTNGTIQHFRSVACITLTQIFTTTNSKPVLPHSCESGLPSASTSHHQSRTQGSGFDWGGELSSTLNQQVLEDSLTAFIQGLDQSWTRK